MMKRHLVGLMLGAAMTLGGTVPVWAQNAAVAPPIVNWSYQRHASTATEGFLRGQADVVQSVGQANYLTSLAAINYQEAVRRNIENRGLYVRTYLENRELNRQYRERYASGPPSKERWARVIAAATPDRLTTEQYDSATGHLIWPHILRIDEYKAFRDRINELMALRTAENSGDGGPIQREVSTLIDGMMALLKSNIDTVSPSQYGEAKWFLLCVDYEAQQRLDAGPAPLLPPADQPGDTPVLASEPNEPAEQPEVNEEPAPANGGAGEDQPVDPEVQAFFKR